MMFENLLIWLLERLYPKKDGPATPTVAVNVSQKQTVKRSVGRPRGSTKKPAVVAKTAAKKKVK
jgi:hypothetical protein